ncbi:MAG: sel1 repeat family protein, partial [Clostridia bacterium]|nr:sel1 repeat family protein [Clostridia bacterium]
LLRFKLAELLSAERTKDGLYTLAMLYAEGVGVKKNAESAITLLDEAVGLGSADAARSLATILLRGELLPPEPALAIAYLERAAALGSPEAYERLGDIYSEGRLAKMDISAALEYYRKAATLGGGSAQTKLDALSYEREGYYARAIREELKNPEGAFESCQLSAAMGYIPAYSTLGSYYENGTGTKRSRREAYRCYLLGAEAGDEAATYNLGRAYAHGIGTARSTSLAIKHLTLASRMGVKAAEGELVALYERKKRKMLRSLFAAAQELYYMHKYEPARKMLEVSAQLGNPKASYLLGALAEFGLGEVYDRARAARLYNEAYDGGFIDSSHEYKKLLLKMSR